MYEDQANGDYVLSVLKDLFNRDGETRHQTSNNIRVDNNIAVTKSGNNLVFKMLDGSTVTITCKEDSYKKWVGKRVYKSSSKPFKSGSKINTVLAVIDHPVMGTPAFTFEEDASVVECRNCRLYDL